MRSSSIAAVVVVALANMLVACGGNAAAGPAPASASPNAVNEPKPAGKGDVKAPGEAKVGDTTKCPISGEEFVVSENSPKVEYEGKTYYTCCAGCQKKLQADPAKYLKAKN